LGRRGADGGVAEGLAASLPPSSPGAEAPGAPPGRRGGGALGRAPGFWSCISSPGATGLRMPGMPGRVGGAGRLPPLVGPPASRRIGLPTSSTWGRVGLAGLPACPTRVGAGAPGRLGIPGRWLNGGRPAGEAGRLPAPGWPWPPWGRDTSCGRAAPPLGRVGAVEPGRCGAADGLETGGAGRGVGAWALGAGGLRTGGAPAPAGALATMVGAAGRPGAGAEGLLGAAAAGLALGRGGGATGRLGGAPALGLTGAGAAAAGRAGGALGLVGREGAAGFAGAAETGAGLAAGLAGAGAGAAAGLAGAAGAF